MEHKLFHKAKLATAIALVSTTTLLTGCLVDGDKSNTNAMTVQEDASRISVTDQATPLAQILGLVQDTNGNPVVGARVSIGSASTTTDANGAYAIANVPVTGFTGGTGAAAATSIQVSIVPASSTTGTNYLSATVSVSPQASTIVQTIDGASGNTEDALLAIITTDGLAVSAGTTVVPAMSSTVTGILRNAATGEVVANTVIGLELLGVNTVAQQQVQNAGVGTSYGVSSYQAATDANGAFVFNNLPVDAEYDLAIEGWIYASQAGGVTGSIALTGAKFSTTPEVTNQNIGTIKANLITSADDVEPFVTSVSGVVVNAAPGLLNDDLDGTQGLTINFSEPLQAIIDANSVYVYNETLKSEVDIDRNALSSTSSPALSADGRSLTITTLAAIAPNQIFSIYLSKVDFLDIANNALEYQAGTPVFLGEDTPAYDTFASGVTSAGSVKLQLQTFSDPITSAGQVVGLAQITNDGGNSDFEILQSLNATFEDVDSGSLRTGDTDIEQLNESEAQTRIQALAAATYADAGIASPPTAVAVDVARVQFSIDGTTESSTYELVLTNEFGVAKALTVDVSSVVGTVAVGTNGTTKVTLELVDGFTGVVDLLLQSVEPGETITISSLTDFGSIDGESSITLTDRIAPTTIIQNSYGQGKDTSAVVGSNYGNGGELSEITAATIGAPLLNITPRLLTPQAGETVSTGVSLPIASTWVALQDKMQDEDEDDNADVDIATDVAAGYTGYDATAFAEWSVGARTMGIAVSEDVTLAGTPLVSAVQVLTGWTAQNDVVLNDKGLAVTADLINFSVPNVIDFANLDHGKTIDFSGVISDESGNTAIAANNPVVVVRDLMPPLLTSAVYSGENIVLTYNENIVVPDNSTITLDGNGNDLSFNVNSTNIEVAANTLTIKRAAFGNLDSELYFNRGLFDHDDDINTVDRAHGLIITEDTEDAREVSWANWDGGAGLVPIPGIAIRDDAGTFELSVAPTATGFTNTSASFTVKYRFSHRIDLFASGFTATSGATTLTGGEINSKFTLTSGTTIDTGSSSAVLDDTGRVLTVTVSTAGGIASGDTFGLTAGTIVSEWDSNDSPITVLTDVTVP